MSFAQSKFIQYLLHVYLGGTSLGTCEHTEFVISNEPGDRLKLNLLQHSVQFEPISKYAGCLQREGSSFVSALVFMATV